LSGFVLDASALLTLIEDENGADRVEEILRAGDFVLPWVGLLEVHYVTTLERDVDEADRRLALLTQSGGVVAWEADEAILRLASRFKAGHSLSFADAITAAYAVANDATLVHKDPELTALRGHVELEALPFKRR
jgi:predicted nucleic acid-binding protein